MLQALVELVGAMLHGVGSTPRRGGDRRAPTRGEQTANLVIAIVLCIVLVACVVGVLVGIGAMLANA